MTWAVVVGAGPAGLAAADRLVERGVETRLYERDPKPGGLCKSFDLSGHVFDLGGHAFFTSNAQVRTYLERAVTFHVQPRRAMVYAYGSFVPYPFQSNLYGLPVDVVRSCVLGAVSRFFSDDNPDPQNLEEFLSQQFGPGIAETFLLPYNRKLWAYPLSGISIPWVGDRIVQPDLTDVVEGAVRRREYRKFPNAEVRYPIEGGFESIYQPIYDRVKSVAVHEEVVAIDLDDRSIQTATSTVRFRELISTIPATRLVEICGRLPDRIRSAAENLQYNSLYLVNLVVSRGKSSIPSGAHRVYVANPDAAFHKLVFNDTSSPSLERKVTFGVQAEVSFSRYKPVARSTLVETVCETLIDMGVMTDVSAVVDSDVREIEFAYPISTVRGAESISLIRDYFRTRGVESIGRFGAWEYINSDGAVARGLMAADGMRKPE